MVKAETDYKKDFILQRVTEIIKDYLYDDDESYAYIDMYFEKSNGENQSKTLRFGKPSKDTPDMYRDCPEGYHRDGSYFDDFMFGPHKSIIWTTLDGHKWEPDA